MAEYSTTSKDKLLTCHFSIRTLFFEVIKHFDHTVLYGYRTPAEQFELFKRGRELKNGLWEVVNPLEVVTYCDGRDKMSRHNSNPAEAIDVAPYPIDWKDIKRFYYFAGFVKGLAKQMEIPIIWGGDFDSDNVLNDQTFYDLPHWELKKE